MNRVHVLDCTLRDGGYCNQWRFGFENIKTITYGLIEANIDIVECGFLTNRVAYNPNITRFTTVDELAAVIPGNRKGKIFVAMMNYGEYDMNDLPEYDGSSIDGIRVAFHKKDLNRSLEICRQIKEKGYKVFIQAMVSISYTDEEFLDLIRQVNEFQPYAFYIVDSFGMMKEKDLIRLFYMVEHNLDKAIWIGFHSHNNMQLAYSNAQSLVAVQTNRDLIIDASIYGMGRGAGNLNTELFVEYINEHIGTTYVLNPLLTIIDEILNEFYQQNYWGYSLPNYLSASHNTHPDYASYLDDKKTLTVEAMNEIFDMMDSKKRVEFDKKYAEQLYLQYMEKNKVQEEHITEFKQTLCDKKVLLIAPGKSSIEEKEKIVTFANKEDVVSISINFDFPYKSTDFIFLSNLRRFREIDHEVKSKYIVTSNIPASNVYLQTKYSDLLNDKYAVSDNAGMMAVKFLIRYGIKEIYLAGFDGYSHDIKENYADEQMNIMTKNAILDAMNIGMEQVLQQYSGQTKIKFLTTPKYVKLQK